jgi:hypothetical protein
VCGKLLEANLDGIDMTEATTANTNKANAEPPQACEQTTSENKDNSNADETNGLLVWRGCVCFSQV